MQRIDAFYLFRVGHQIHRILDIDAELWDGQENVARKRGIVNDLLETRQALSEFLYASIFDLSISQRSGHQLIIAINGLIEACEKCQDDQETVKHFELWPVQQAYQEFEAVLKAELGQTGIFLVADKNAMNTLTLIEQGEKAFPAKLEELVPDSIEDVRDAMSCIALELPTAAAFHLHRANETVLKSYYHSESNEVVPPKKTMGQLIQLMEDKGIGREEIRSSLRDIVRLHRNPTIHPGTRISDVEEALNLYGAIRSVIGFMIKEME
ncbi:hypothetical protein ROLI_034570 [Roseobacter fucihabitans]|uniref:DUF4145 domain-containing protein n=1 Tax=Roseobacter fucihabitans TaxID=1537242 RepID=A0ABZ2BWD4_9RHOB|nr:hypothetical protein [Roseobacter litoralis]MBC6966848.1 hypothetical protein [Roseobacter litoralis]